MSLEYNKSIIPQARSLRTNMTPQERKLWYVFLSEYRPRFQRQKAIGNFIVDFFCAKAFLALEIDGIQHDSDDGVENDKIRTEQLNNLGVTVFRITNRQVERDFDAVCEQIDRVVKELIAEKPSTKKPGKSFKMEQFLTQPW